MSQPTNARWGNVTLIFNIDEEALAEAGIDVTTSEGKMELKTFILDAVLNDSLTRDFNDERERAMARALLFEG